MVLSAQAGCSHTSSLQITRQKFGEGSQGVIPAALSPAEQQVPKVKGFCRTIFYRWKTSSDQNQGSLASVGDQGSVGLFREGQATAESHPGVSGDTKTGQKGWFWGEDPSL